MEEDSATGRSSNRRERQTISNSLTVHEAYKRGDLYALRTLLGNPMDFLNCRGPRGMGEIIFQYASYHGPLPFIRKLLELGANPNYENQAGLPSLIAALSSDRTDKPALVELLLSFGAAIQQVSHNGYTPFHWAAAEDDPAIIEL